MLGDPFSLWRYPPMFCMLRTCQDRVASACIALDWYGHALCEIIWHLCVARRLTECATCAGSMPPNHFSDASAAFPSQYSEPPTSDDMAYVPMSSFGPESSLAPATTSDRGELNYVYSEPSRQDPAFPSPFAVRSSSLAS